MKLKIPPVIVVLIVALAMWALNYLTEEEFSIAFQGQKIIKEILFSSCMIVVVAALLAFRKLKTTVDPMNPDKASNLVTIGIYRLSRNPMYLAMLLLLAGWVVKLGNPLNLVLLLFFIWYMNQFQIKAEEEVLRELFGKEYQNYCRKVRRWI